MSFFVLLYSPQNVVVCRVFKTASKAISNILKDLIIFYSILKYCESGFLRSYGIDKEMYVEDNDIYRNTLLKTIKGYCKFCIKSR